MVLFGVRLRTAFLRMCRPHLRTCDHDAKLQVFSEVAFNVSISFPYNHCRELSTLFQQVRTCVPGFLSFWDLKIDYIETGKVVACKTPLKSITLQVFSNMIFVGGLRHLRDLCK